MPIYDSDGERVARTIPEPDPNEPQCGVLVDLQNIHSLFNPDSQLHALDDDDDDDDAVPEESQYIHVNAYPLAFLKSIGNLQATGVPHCFGPTIATINQQICLDPALPDSQDSDDDSDRMSILEEHRPVHRGGSSPLKPVASQFYNYIAHRTAAKAGRHYSQQGTVTAAVAGAFAEVRKDKNKASELQEYCKQGLPFDRFHNAISLEDCPSCCRMELVYSVDVQALTNRSGRY